MVGGCRGFEPFTESGTPVLLLYIIESIVFINQQFGPGPKSLGCFQMKYHTQVAPFFLCVTLVFSEAKADVLLYDTGATSADYSNAGGVVGYNGTSQFSRGQSFTNNQGALTITSIKAWLSVSASSTIVSGTFNLSLFSSSGTPGSNAVPFTQLATTGPISANNLGLTTTAQLISFNNLNWTLDGSASTYFFVLDARNMTGPSDNYFIWQNSASTVTGQNEAYSTNFTTWSHSAATGAAQVYGVVPEPGTWTLMALGLSLAGAFGGFPTIRRRFLVAVNPGC